MKKWIVDSKYTTKEESIKYYKRMGENSEDYDIEDFCEVEISVVKSSNHHGIKSYGWGGKDKIILFDNVADCDKKDIDWFTDAANILCNGLNKKEK